MSPFTPTPHLPTPDTLAYLHIGGGGGGGSEGGDNGIGDKISA